MKRLILPLTLLLTLFATAPLFAVDSSQPPTMTENVIRMTQAGVGDAAIIAFVQNRRGTYAVNADDMIAMANARVSNEVMKFTAEAAGTRNQNWRDGDRQAENASRDDRADDSRETRTVYVPSPRVYISPFWDPYYYYYDPFWYGPRLSLNFGFGYYRGFGHGFYRGGYHGGGGFHRGGRH